MSRLQLIVEPDAYELRLDGERLTPLAGGAAALLSGAGAPLREIDIETAIERAEEWLMPFSAALRGLPLEIVDRTGRIRWLPVAPARCSVEQVEQAFARAHAAVAHGRSTDPHGVADVVLVRELAHHGRLADIVRRGADA